MKKLFKLLDETTYASKKAENAIQQIFQQAENHFPSSSSDNLFLLIRECLNDLKKEKELEKV